MPKKGNNTTTTTLVVSAPRPAQQQKKKKNKPKQSKGKGRGGGGVSSALVHAVCALTDPFCVQARGARHPSETNLPSLGFPVAYIGSMGSSAAGQTAMVMTPGFGYGLNTCSASGTTVSTPATLLPWDPSGTWTSLTREYRITSVGVRFKYMGPPLYASGRVILATSASFSLSSSFDMAVPSEYALYKVFTVAELIKNPLTFIFTPDPVQARIFVEQNGNNSPNNAWNSLMFYADGLPVSSSGLFQFEYIQNMEIRVISGNTVSVFAKPPPAINPVLQTAVSRVQSTINPILQESAAGLENTFKRVAVGALTRLGQYALVRGATAVGGYLGGPPGAALAGGGAMMAIEDVD